eukprot:1391039-Prymnesium_polylepis.1
MGVVCARVVRVGGARRRARACQTADLLEQREEGGAHRVRADGVAHCPPRDAAPGQSAASATGRGPRRVNRPQVRPAAVRVAAEVPCAHTTPMHTARQVSHARTSH